MNSESPNQAEHTPRHGEITLHPLPTDVLERLASLPPATDLSRGLATQLIEVARGTLAATDEVGHLVDRILSQALRDAARIPQDRARELEQAAEMSRIQNHANTVTSRHLTDAAQDWREAAEEIMALHPRARATLLEQLDLTELTPDDGTDVSRQNLTQTDRPRRER